MKHSHKSIETVKGINVLQRCNICGKRIIKGKKTPDKAFGSK